MEWEMKPGLVRNPHYGWSKKKASRRAGPSSRIRFQRALRALRKETRQYFQETSLHGFKYITSPDSTIVERCIWILVCTLGIVFSVILMCLVWQRFQQNPTVTTIDTTSHPIWELAFPAVTICNFNKIYEPIADRLRKNFQELGLNHTEIEDFLQSLPKLIRPDYIKVDVAPGMRALAALGYGVEDLMQVLMQPCEKMLVKCAWLGQTYNCSKMFQVIKSIEGFCCAFNYHALISDLRTIQEIDKQADTTTSSVTSPNPMDWVPGVGKVQRVTGSGRDVGLTVVFDVEGHLYGGATRPYIGASILIHDPEDYPEISLLTALTEPGKEVDIAITGTIIQSVENVRSLPIHQRQCWFDDEAKLASSDEYSYQTCVTECRIDHIISLCSCVPFYYPKLYPDVRTCELTDVRCMREYRRILSSLQTPIDMEAGNNTMEKAECNCLPQCSDKWYSLIAETANIKNIKYDAPMFQYYSYGLDIRNLSLMHVYFRDITCLKYRRDILLTWDGLFASFGGIFGLCLGGSVISLVELVYYYLVRIFHKKKHREAIYAADLVASKFRNKSFKRANGTTTNGNLDNLSIFRDNFNFRPNNHSLNELDKLSTELKAFRVTSRLKNNTLMP